MLAAMTWNEITFTTFGGLRGAVSLILAQVVVTEQAPHSDLQNRKVTAQARIRLCTALSICIWLDVSMKG